MKRYFLATAAVLGLSAGSALAAGPDATTTTVAPTAPPLGAASAYYGYSSGYVFPDDGSPSGTQPMAHAVPRSRGTGSSRRSICIRQPRALTARADPFDRGRLRTGPTPGSDHRLIAMLGNDLSRIARCAFECRRVRLVRRPGGTAWFHCRRCAERTGNRLDRSCVA